MARAQILALISYVKDKHIPHSTQLLMMCSEVSTLKLKNLSTALSEECID